MTITTPRTRAEVAEALFASDLQPSPTLPAEAVRAAIDATVAKYGSAGCAARVATAFGDHPELAVRRMIWVRRIMDLGLDRCPNPAGSS
ncbi:MAG TPA: hypothetical protein VIL37_14165 [Natronosporangium sp.]